ncbi:hypothetical protein [Eubacterium sp.]|uniref:hypothetical protein n=1 Tax=Eubacterium sp. TaxID=142586 RepID=UPI00267597FC|nr:hypothetical protein [uncultured Eubacterium sp.]
MYYFLKLTKDMTIERIEMEDYDWESLAKLINCDYIEQASISRLKTTPKLCFIVDEEGALKSDREINSLASSLYGRVLFGDVLIAHEGFNEYGYLDIMPLSETMAANLFDMFTHVLREVKGDLGELQDNV